MHAHARTGHKAAPRFSIDEGAAEAWEVVTLISFAVADTSVLVAVPKKATD